MADTTEGDTVQVQHLDFLALALISLIAGLVIHLFIIGVNVNDWLKGRSVTPVDHIVTSLGISRICAQCAVTLDAILIIPYSYFSLVLKEGVYVLFGYANIWLTTLLSVFLCLKISNLHTRLFLYLRRMILHRTGHLIVVSVLLSAFNCLISLTTTILWHKTGTCNETVNNPFMNCFNFNSIYNFIIGVIIPAILYCISSVLLFTSLYHHTTRMKMSSNLSINLETYYSAMRFVSFTFIYNTIYYIADFLSFFYYYFYCLDLPWVYIVLDFLPVLHSSYLIYRTAKLRNQMSKVLHNVIGFLFQMKDTETRENIEIVDQ